MIARRLLAAVLLLLPLSVSAQQHPNLARGFDPEKAYQMGELDHVNLFNGNLVVTLPIGPKYPVNGLSYNLTLIYNGNPWDYRSDANAMEAVPSRFANAGLGWQLSMGELTGPDEPAAGRVGENGRWVYAAPDGAERVFYPYLHPEEASLADYAGNETNPGVAAVVGYTRDSSYLRLRRIGPRQIAGGVHVSDYEVEFPDGTIHTFTSKPYSNGPAAYATEEVMAFRLTKIRDRFGNFVAVEYTDPATDDGEASWKITDSIGRVHTVTLSPETFFAYRNSTESRYLVKEVRMEAFAPPNGQPRQVVYTFQYGPYETISLPCGDTTGGTGPDGEVVDDDTQSIFLQSIVVGDTTSSATETMFAMPDYTRIVRDGADDTIVCSSWAGHLLKLQLPTGGWIGYTAGKRIFPGDREDTGGVIGGGTIGPIHQFSAAVGTRTMYDRDGTALATWQYSSRRFNLSSQGGKAREMVVLVTDPTNRTTAHHFNISKGPWDACFAGGSMWEYGLPFTRSKGTESGDFLLSTELFDGQCADWEPVADGSCINPRGRCKKADGTYIDAAERRTYVQYAADTIATVTDGRDGDQNWRVQASRLIQRDSGCPDCTSDTVHTGFDGLGHYRTATQSSTIPRTPTRTTTTWYNANTALGNYAANGTSNPAHYMVKTTEPWILGLHDSVVTSDSGADVVGTATIVQELCFNRTNGFLLRKRARGGAGQAASDVLTAFGVDAAGNVALELFAGGDDTPLAANFDTCTSPLPIPRYEVVHGYQHGVRSSSAYVGTNFKILDATIDRATGLPRSTRDSAGAQTDFEYDHLQRLTKVQPPLGASTHYKYALTANPPAIEARQKNGETVLTDARFYYDGIGRMIQSRTRMPSSQWAVREITYDALGRKTAASSPETAAGPGYADIAPSKTTTWSYADPLGRVKAITQPDGAIAGFVYFGAREVRRTSSIAAEGSSGLGASFTVTEVYDGFGRLGKIVEPESGVTSYSYDAGNRLTKVCTQGSGGSCLQTRLFDYDGRGFLKSEQHPEHNKATYTYDAKGHPVLRSLDGTIMFDQKFTYDVAERLITLETRDHNAPHGFKVLKSFTYATGNATNNWKKGRLESAVRNNRSIDGAGSTKVTETYEYDQNGRRTKRTTKLEDLQFGGVLRTFSHTQSHDLLGAPATISYPVCVSGLCGGAIFNDVHNTYAEGALTGVSGFARSIEYTASGLPSKVEHDNGVTDEIAEDAGMGRPKSITVREGVDCVAPVIATHPQSDTIARGTSTRLSVAVSTAGSGALQYQWLQDGVEIRGAAGATFDTPIAQETHAYTVQVSNSCGAQLSQAATITMVDPPAAPTGLHALRAAGSMRVDLTWNSVAGATSYVVERRANGGAWQVLPLGISGTGASDTTVAAETVYLYRVRAVVGGDVASLEASNVDVASTIAFAPLARYSTKVGAAHLDELLNAVNGLRKATGGPPLTWTALLPYGVAPPAPGSRIRKDHLLVLRSALAWARVDAGLPAVSFNDPDLTGRRPRIEHVEDIRRGVE